MKYEDFVRQVAPFVIFGDDVLSTLQASVASLRVNLSRWVKEGKIVRLKRGLYSLPPQVQPQTFSQSWLANQLYSPSYLSLEYALSWYDLIPERVYTFTSVTTRKTQQFKNPLGNFIYRTIKLDLFFGYQILKDEYDRDMLMATPEKAILDYIYLDSHWQANRDYIENSLRLQQLEQLKRKHLKNFAKRFHSKKMTMAAALLIELAKK